MAKDKNTTSSDVRQATEETAVIVEDALRSIADNIGDIFKQALEAGDDISKSLMKDIKSSFTSLAKISSDLIKNGEKAIKGQLTQRDINKEMLDREIKMKALKTQIQILEKTKKTASSCPINKWTGIDYKDYESIIRSFEK